MPPMPRPPERLDLAACFAAAAAAATLAAFFASAFWLSFVAPLRKAAAVFAESPAWPSRSVGLVGQREGGGRGAREGRHHGADHDLLRGARGDLARRGTRDGALPDDGTDALLVEGGGGRTDAVLGVGGSVRPGVAGDVVRPVQQLLLVVPQLLRVLLQPLQLLLARDHDISWFLVGPRARRGDR